MFAYMMIYTGTFLVVVYSDEWHTECNAVDWDTHRIQGFMEASKKVFTTHRLLLSFHKFPVSMRCC